MDKKLLNQQSQHWESNFSSKPEMFGLEPSYSAKKSLEIFKKYNIKNILELGAGLELDPDGWETVKPYLRKVPDPSK